MFVRNTSRRSSSVGAERQLDVLGGDLVVAVDRRRRVEVGQLAAAGDRAARSGRVACRRAARSGASASPAACRRAPSCRRANRPRAAGSACAAHPAAAGRRDLAARRDDDRRLLLPGETLEGQAAQQLLAEAGGTDGRRADLRGGDVARPRRRQLHDARVDGRVGCRPRSRAPGSTRSARRRRARPPWRRWRGAGSSSPAMSSSMPQPSTSLPSLPVIGGPSRSPLAFSLTLAKKSPILAASGWISVSKMRGISTGIGETTTSSSRPSVSGPAGSWASRLLPSSFGGPSRPLKVRLVRVSRTRTRWRGPGTL